jgi:predicted outer membrane repeat protein
MDANGNLVDRDSPGSSFKLTDGISLIGGFPAAGGNSTQRDWKNNPTILSGDILGNDGTDWPDYSDEETSLYNDNVYHILTCAEDDIIDGFIFQHGEARLHWGDKSAPDGGAAVQCIDISNFNIKNCIFNKNFTNTFGGAVLCRNSSGIFTNCTFENNIAGVLGGAIFVENCDEIEILDSCYFNNNIADLGGAIYSSFTTEFNINQTKFINNHSTWDGGAVYVSGNLAFNLKNSILNSNTATNGGGGIYSSAEDNLFVNLFFYQNSSGYDGGAIFINQADLYGDQKIVNCVFSNNSSEMGAAIYAPTLSPETNFYAYNCTFYYNWGNMGASIYWGYNSVVQSDQYQPLVKNCIFWYIPTNVNTPNQYAIFYPGSCTPNVVSSWVPDYHNSPESSSPIFVNINNVLGTDGIYGTEDDGLQLNDGSPCIDYGQAYSDMSDFILNSDGNPVDITQRLRIINTIDAGAYEKQ